MTDLYYFVFYIEKQFQNLGIDWNKIYQDIYEYAIIILAIVFIKKMIQTYFLWKSGEDDVSPVHVVLGLFEAIIIIIGFGYMYSFFKDVEKELEFIEKNEEMIKKYASIIYNQKINNYDVSYIKNVVDFKLLEEKCKEYKNPENN